VHRRHVIAFVPYNVLVTYNVWADAEQAVTTAEGGRSRYERLANFIRDAVRDGHLRPGEQLPTVRELASRIGLSVTTVVSAYSTLRNEGVVIGEVGRGTFVRGAEPAQRAEAMIQPAAPSGPATWRRRALANTEHRLNAAHLQAADLMRGSANSDFLPLRAIKRAWMSVARELTAADVQYPVSTHPEPELLAELLPLLMRDGIAADEPDVMVGHSTIQFLSLTTEWLRRERPGKWPLTVALEEPGYQAAMDVLEGFGCGLIGMATDEHGVLPDQLRSALDAGALLVVLTPRASNPAGTTWSEARKQDIAAIVATHPDVIVIEDDYFADGAISRPGSLISDTRICDQVVHIRSFAKAIAPDLRVAAAVAKPALRAAITEVKYLTVGWTSRATQRVLARVLAADDTAALLEKARMAYAERRQVAEDVLTDGLREMGGFVQRAHDGLYTWISLPPGSDAGIVAEHTAQLGFLVAPGEPFFIRPGSSRFLRLNAGSATAQEVGDAAKAILLATMSADARMGTRLTP
jgi:DNA-binding transcriptional MocR family regulator